MPFLSVCVPTMRVGGLDLLFESLAGQTFTDFELVLSDALYDHRADLVAETIACYPYQVKHVKPRASRFPLNQFSHVANEALANASGEIVVFFVDYTWAPPDLLAAHAGFHQVSDRNQGLMLPHRYIVLPPLNGHFQPYAKDQIDKYAGDVESGALEDVMWSLFAQDVFVGHQFTEQDHSTGEDPKLTWPAGPVPASYFHGKNESCALERVLNINGWDEDLDGSHCYQDTDLSERLASHGQVNWHLQNHPVAQIVNPRTVFPFPRRERPIEDNERIWRAKKAAGYPTPNAWKLRA